MPKTCGYQYCGNDSSNIKREMFAHLIFYFPVMHISLYNFIGWYLNNFTVLPILEGGIICLSNFIFMSPFIIKIWVINGGTTEFKLK